MGWRFKSLLHQQVWKADRSQLIEPTKKWIAKLLALGSSYLKLNMTQFLSDEHLTAHAPADKTLYILFGVTVYTLSRITENNSEVPKLFPQT